MPVEHTQHGRRLRAVEGAAIKRCLARASREYVAARRARDTLLLLSTLSTRTEAQPDHEGLLNGAKLDGSAQLQPGDTVGLGASSFRLVLA